MDNFYLRNDADIFSICVADFGEVNGVQPGYVEGPWGVQPGYMEGPWGTTWVYGRSVGDIVGIWRVCGVYCGVNEVHEVYKGPYQVYTGQGQDATRSL